MQLKRSPFGSEETVCLWKKNKCANSNLVAIFRRSNN